MNVDIQGINIEVYGYDDCDKPIKDFCQWMNTKGEFTNPYKIHEQFEEYKETQEWIEFSEDDAEEQFQSFVLWMEGLFKGEKDRKEGKILIDNALRWFLQEEGNTQKNIKGELESLVYAARRLRVE